MFERRKINWWGAALVGVLIIYFGLLVYRLDTTPTLLIDEANYANEVSSFLKFGTDIHGLKMPVYLSSVWGQGQSILYAWLIIPLLKVFGYSFFGFRLGMVLLTMLLMVITILTAKTRHNYQPSFVLLMSLVAAPGLFMMGRWVLDANVAPIVLMIGALMLIQAVHANNKFMRVALLALATFVMVLSTYGYIVAWFYVPMLFIALLVLNLRVHWLSWKEVGLMATLAVVVALPLVYFAYTVNVQGSREVQQFLFFDMPVLSQNRTESLISFSGFLPLTIAKNVGRGLIGFVTGNDNLPWNAVTPFGVVLPWLLPLAVYGTLANLEKFGSKIVDLRRMLNAMVLAFVPVSMVVTFNFNHWNFLLLPLALLTGMGALGIWNKVPKVMPALAVVAIGSFVAFVPGYRDTFLNIEVSGKANHGLSNRVNDIETIDGFMSTKEGSKLYIPGMMGFYPYWRFINEPISNKEYLMISDASEDFSKTNVWAENRYLYLRNYEYGKTTIKKRDYVLLSRNRFNQYRNIYEPVKKVNFLMKDYVIAQNKR